MRKGCFIGVAFLATLRALPIAFAQEVHFSPEERLDAIDAALIGTAKQSIDLASYALTNPVVIDALDAAEQRGVAIRIVLDPRERHDFVKLGDLSDEVRIKRGGPYMQPESLFDRRGSADDFVHGVLPTAFRFMKVRY